MKFLKSLVAVCAAALMILPATVPAYALTATNKVAVSTSADYYPGVEYDFAITLDGKKLSKTTMKNYRASVTISQGKSYVDSAKVSKIDDYYYLVFRAKPRKYEDSKTIKGNVVLEGRTSSTKDVKIPFTIEVLFDEEEIIEDSVVELTERSSRELTFSKEAGEVDIYFDDFASFTTEFTKKTKVNLRYSTDEIEAITAANPTAYTQFLLFNEKQSFSRSGEIQFMCKMGYLYSIDSNNQLTLLRKDTDYEEPSARVKELYRFVASDEPLKNPSGTAANGGSTSKPAGPSEGSTGTSSEPSSTRLDVSKENVTSLPKSGNCYIMTSGTIGDYITREDYNNMVSYLGSNGIAFRRYNADGTTLTQLILYPNSKHSVPEDLWLGVQPTAPKTQELFNQWFSNKVVAFKMSHLGNIGTPVEVAVKLDLSGLDKTKLRAWAYNPKTNSFDIISNPRLSVDSSGFLHLTTSVAGDILITDSAMISR